MAPASVINFIETALTCTSPFALSYPDPKQKLLIRKHLRSLIQEHPTFSISTGKFVHNDGTTVNLLYATGQVHISNYTPPIALTIWLHDNYPYMAPIVFASSNSVYPIRQDHPFVDASSGAVTCSYRELWLFPKGKLTELVGRLVKLLSFDNPFIYSPAPASFTRPSLVTKMDALDWLWGMLHYDLMALNAKHAEEVDGLHKLQAELVDRDDVITSIIGGLERERRNLKDRALEVMNQSDLLINWLRVHEGTSSVFMSSLAVTEEGRDDAFGAADEDSKLVIDCLAADSAIDDLIDALDLALEQQVLNIGEYVRQVRALAREQFHSRRKLVKEPRYRDRQAHRRLRRKT